MVQLIQGIGILYKFFIFEGFISFWMIAFSFLAKFAFKPGFLHISKKSAIVNFS